LGKGNPLRRLIQQGEGGKRKELITNENRFLLFGGKKKRRVPQREGIPKKRGFLVGEGRKAPISKKKDYVRRKTREKRKSLPSGMRLTKYKRKNTRRSLRPKERIVGGERRSRYPGRKEIQVPRLQKGKSINPLKKNTRGGSAKEKKKERRCAPDTKKKRIIVKAMRGRGVSQKFLRGKKEELSQLEGEKTGPSHKKKKKRAGPVPTI